MTNLQHIQVEINQDSLVDLSDETILTKQWDFDGFYLTCSSRTTFTCKVSAKYIWRGESVPPVLISKLNTGESHCYCTSPAGLLHLLLHLMEAYRSAEQSSLFTQLHHLLQGSLPTLPGTSSAKPKGSLEGVVYTCFPLRKVQV